MLCFTAYVRLCFSFLCKSGFRLLAPLRFSCPIPNTLSTRCSTVRACCASLRLCSPHHRPLTSVSMSSTLSHSLSRSPSPVADARARSLSPMPSVPTTEHGYNTEAPINTYNACSALDGSVMSLLRECNNLMAQAPWQLQR